MQIVAAGKLQKRSVLQKLRSETALLIQGQATLLLKRGLHRMLLSSSSCTFEFSLQTN